MMTFDTPESISYFRLCSMKGRIKLEIAGMRCKGRSTTAIAKGEFGLPKGWRKAQVLEFVTALVELHQTPQEGANPIQVSPPVYKALRSYLNTLEN
jgi:hypothetical protein